MYKWSGITTHGQQGLHENVIHRILSIQITHQREQLVLRIIQRTYFHHPPPLLCTGARSPKLHPSPSFLWVCGTLETSCPRNAPWGTCLSLLLPSPSHCGSQQYLLPAGLNPSGQARHASPLRQRHPYKRHGVARRGRSPVAMTMSLSG